MPPEHIALVLQQTLAVLHRHFERVMMPDEEFVAMVGVIIASANSLLDAASTPVATRHRIEKQLLEQAKTAWLGTCARADLPSAASDAELPELARDFDRMYRRARTRSQQSLDIERS